MYIHIVYIYTVCIILYIYAYIYIHRMTYILYGTVNVATCSTQG